MRPRLSRVTATSAILRGGRLEVRFHVVDIAAHNMNGKCGCEYFEFALENVVAGLPPEIQGLGKYRCSHIDAVREFALDLTILNHEHRRYADANGQREEAQP